jgi:hypothetical protein
MATAQLTASKNAMTTQTKHNSVCAGVGYPMSILTPTEPPIAMTSVQTILPRPSLVFVGVVRVMSTATAMGWSNANASMVFAPMASAAWIISVGIVQRAHLTVAHV